MVSCRCKRSDTAPDPSQLSRFSLWRSRHSYYAFAWRSLLVSKRSSFPLSMRCFGIILSSLFLFTCEGAFLGYWRRGVCTQKESERILSRRSLLHLFLHLLPPPPPLPVLHLTHAQVVCYFAINKLFLISLNLLSQDLLRLFTLPLHQGNHSQLSGRKEWVSLFLSGVFAYHMMIQHYSRLGKSALPSIA